MVVGSCRTPRGGSDGAEQIFESHRRVRFSQREASVTSCSAAPGPDRYSAASAGRVVVISVIAWNSDKNSGRYCTRWRRTRELLRSFDR